MRREELYLADLVDNTRAVRRYLDGMTRERWDADGMLRDAVRPAGYDADVARPLVQACVAICKSCGDECERHAHMPHCRVCAEACRRCEQACRELLDALK